LSKPWKSRVAVTTGETCRRSAYHVPHSCTTFAATDVHAKSVNLSVTSRCHKRVSMLRPSRVPKVCVDTARALDLVNECIPWASFATKASYGGTPLRKRNNVVVLLRNIRRPHRFQHRCVVLYIVPLTLGAKTRVVMHITAQHCAIPLPASAPAQSPTNRGRLHRRKHAMCSCDLPTRRCWHREIETDTRASLPVVIAATAAAAEHERDDASDENVRNHAPNRGVQGDTENTGHNGHGDHKQAKRGHAALGPVDTVRHHPREASKARRDGTFTAGTSTLARCRGAQYDTLARVLRANSGAVPPATHTTPPWDRELANQRHG